MEGPQPQTKEFGLMQADLLAVQEYNRIANSIMGVFLSHLATSRFGYKVTQNTQFQVQDGKLLISEIVQPATPENQSPLETA